jgi:hypothetical protein
VSKKQILSLFATLAIVLCFVGYAVVNHPADVTETETPSQENITEFQIGFNPSPAFIVLVGVGLFIIAIIITRRKEQ